MGNIRIADFKSRVGEHLRQGHVLTVLDRNTPIAQVIPYEGQGGMLEVRFPHPDHPKLPRISLPPPLRLPKMLLPSSSRNDSSTGDCLY